MQLGPLASFLLFPGIYGASNDYSFLNMSMAVTPFDSLVSDSSPFALERRQGLQCEVPGGPICDSIHCCEPGYQCCPSGCCPLTSNCFGVGRCCPKANTDCGGLACCPPTYSCCGSTCCTSVQICERGECIDKNLKDKVVRFNLTTRNKELLINMCNGLRGKNTETLTYRGPDLNERDRTRTAAGCVDGFCARQIAANLVPATHDSCDEYPPASSLEGGNARPAIQRAVNCIPLRQNRSQGGKMGGFQSTLRKLGYTFQRGDKFVISIDCDGILSKQHSEGKRDVGLVKRDGNTITLSGNETVDPTLLFEEGQTLRYLDVPLGDLGPGRYTAHIKVVSGSTVGGYVNDNEGYNYTTNDAGLSVGQTQDYSFSLQYATPGVGVFIGTTDNSTTITWTFEGTMGNETASSTNSPTPTGSGSFSGAQGTGISFALMSMMPIACLLGLILQ